MEEKLIKGVDLHRHMEGSLRLGTIIEVARQHGLDLPAWTPEELARHAQVLAPASSLSEVLAFFAISKRVMVSPEAIARFSAEAVEDAAAEGVVLLELRMSPGFMAAATGMPLSEALDAALRGAREAAESLSLPLGITAICSRDRGVANAEGTVKAAIESGQVHGLDLAGDESLFPPEPFVHAFAMAREAGLGITVHAGETGDPANVAFAVDQLGATRIGHGAALALDPALAKRLAERGVVLEVCPTSNLRVGLVPSLDLHPARRLADMGVAVTFHADDPGLFAIDLPHEYRVVQEEMGFSHEELERSIEVALRSAFVDEAARAQGLRALGH